LIFIDASAFVAIIAGETDADELSDRLQAHATRTCSALSIWETLAALCYSHHLSPLEARDTVERYRAAANIIYVPIGPTEADLAATAYERYGQGRHKAGLNMGDRFAYACAKSNNATLLFKGDDFAQTDILAA
jgi:ribonuclease VapC